MSGTRRRAAGAIALASLVLAGCGGGSGGSWSEDDCIERVRQVVQEAGGLEPEAQAARLQDLQKELVDHQCPQGLDGEPEAPG